jgi:acetyl esterase/lipase
MQDPVIRRAIAALGNDLKPDTLPAVVALFDREQREMAAAIPARAIDIAYGPHERHRLDVYAPHDGGERPVLLFVHGGGFLRGDKGDDGSWQNANVARMAAQAGLVGVTINYRLAPDHPWPTGADDVAAAVRWVRAHIAEYGGDPDTLIVAGTSAGAAHVAGFIDRHPDEPGVRGAILLSGVYGVTEASDMRDRAYYGEDMTQHAAMMPLGSLVETELPLFVLASEFDPPRFQTEFVGLLQRRLERWGVLPRAYMATGHNHYSLAYHLGTAERRVSDELLSFIEQCGVAS